MCSLGPPEASVKISADPSTWEFLDFFFYHYGPSYCPIHPFRMHLTHLEDFAVAALPEHFLQLEILRPELHPARVDDFLWQGDGFRTFGIEVAVDV